SSDGSRIAAHQAVGMVLNLWDLGPTSCLATEPEPGDVAGWLRRSRALAELGDSAGAAASMARAVELGTGDASPWIEHALSLWQRGDSTQAQAAWARVIDCLPEDVGRWIEIGHLLERAGRTGESATALAKARDLAERRLSRDPDDEQTAADLAELLPEADQSRGWAILQPGVLTSAGGATLNLLPDGSVLTDGIRPNFDAYTVEAVAPLDRIIALRLEALPDASLPRHGPGRAQNGSFHLDRIRLS